MEVIKCCQEQFSFELPSDTLARRTNKFLANLCQCVTTLLLKLLCVCNIPVITVLLLFHLGSFLCVFGSIFRK